MDLEGVRDFKGVELVYVSLTGEGESIGTVSAYTLSIVNLNPIVNKSSIDVTLPSYLSFETNECSVLTGLNAEVLCTKESKSRLHIANISELGSENLIRIRLAKIRNP